MNASDVATNVAEALSPVLLGVLTWTAARLSRLIEARATEERVRGALLRLDHAVSTVVRELQQVTVDALKTASRDGKLGANVPSMLQRAALWRVRQHLGAKGIADLARVLGLDAQSVDRLIGTRVEAAVYDLKRQLSGHGTATRGPSGPAN